MEGVPSPSIFRLWAGITAIAGICERRLWIQSAGERLYPNLYVLLVSPPGVGKTQAIKAVGRLWQAVPGLIAAPDSMTKAALIDELEGAKRVVTVSPVEIAEFASIQVAADELGVLIAAHDLEYLSNLNKIYDNPEVYIESRRMFQGKKKRITAPTMTILAGTQPGFLASVLPEEAWTMGTTSRLIMVYSSKVERVTLFDVPTRDPLRHETLLSDLTSIMSMYGELKVTKEAKLMLMDLQKRGIPPIPSHSKLEHYNTRRILSLLKLSQVSSVSRGVSYIINDEDVTRAVSWLLEAELAMPDIFRTMTQKSDASLIQELHIFVWQLYTKHTPPKPVHQSMIWHFLKDRAPSDRIPKILDLAEKANVLVRIAGTESWRPVPRDQIGLE